MSEETIKLIEEKIEELYNSLMDRPLRVLGIFNDFFGEDRVDMQEYCSLKEFKLWMSTEPLSAYMPYEYINSIDLGNRINPIIALPEDQIDKAIRLLTSTMVKERIGYIKFSNIFILVHFPHVRITNEHGRFTDINNLWAKVPISYDGRLRSKFALNRSEYTLLHISSEYMHSHIPGIPTDNFTEFLNPCTGTGPINGTMETLYNTYDEDIWNMFCLELSKYVTVESLTGIPYRRLESLGTDNMRKSRGTFVTYLSTAYFGDTFDHSKLRWFVKDFIKLRRLKFNYINGSYSIGMSFIEYIILISNEFIKWYNNQFNKGKLTTKFEELKRKGVLTECIIHNGRIYYDNDSNNPNNYIQYIGNKVCTFKGKQITLNITDIFELKNENKSIILNIKTALYILTVILKVLNYRYGRNKAIHESSKIGTEIRYL